MPLISATFVLGIVPYNYDHRWINLHGLGAITVSSNSTGKTIVKPLSLPENEWPALAKQQRDQYISDFNKAVEMAQKMRNK